MPIINQLKNFFMKKVLLLLAGVALLAAFTTSCNKGCVCKTYAAGILVSSEEVTVADGQTCSDYTSYEESISTGVKCK